MFLSLFIFMALSGYAEGIVHCGGHGAEECSACPGLHGRSWCNGDCSWCHYETGKCYPKGTDCTAQANKEKKEKEAADKKKAKECDDLKNKNDNLVGEIARLRKELAQMKPVNGAWTSWSGYSKCSTTCSKGAQIRKRSCTNPAPAKGGTPCSGEATETKACHNTRKCGRMLITSSTVIRKGRLLTRVTMEKEYTVSFDVFPTSFIRPGGNWGSVIHFSAFGGNEARYGDRNPAVWFAPNSNVLHIASAVSGTINYARNSQPLPKNKWSNVVIQQKKDGGGRYRYTIDVNGKTIHRAVNTDPRRFVNVKVYVADPWYPPQAGYIRNLSLAGGHA